MMKLAEALMLRADANKRIQQLQQRLTRSVRVQEGDAPPEDPAELFAELERTLSQFTLLVRQINRTNSTILLADGITLTDALAARDALKLERGILSSIITAATGTDNPMMTYRVTRSEVKFVSTINVADVQKRADDLARRFRELDARIQALNWNVDLVE